MISLLKKYLLFQDDTPEALEAVLEQSTVSALSEYFSAKETQTELIGENVERDKERCPTNSQERDVEKDETVVQCPKGCNIIENNSKEISPKPLERILETDQKNRSPEDRKRRLERDTRARRRTVNRLLTELKNEKINVATLMDGNGRIFFSIEMTDIIQNDNELNEIATLMQKMVQESIEKLKKYERKRKNEKSTKKEIMRDENDDGGGKTKEKIDEKLTKEKEVQEREVDEVTRKIIHHLVVQSTKKIITDEGTQVSQPCCSRSKVNKPRQSHGQLNKSNQSISEMFTATNQKSTEMFMRADLKSASSMNDHRENVSEKSVALKGDISNIISSSNEKEMRSLLYSYILSHLDAQDVKNERHPSFKLTPREKRRTSNKLHVQVPFFDHEKDFVKCEVYLKRRQEILKKKLGKGLKRRSVSYLADLTRPKRPKDEPFVIKIKRDKEKKIKEKTYKDVEKSLLRLKKQIEKKLRRSKKYEIKKRKKDEEWTQIDVGSSEKPLENKKWYDFRIDHRRRHDLEGTSFESIPDDARDRPEKHETLNNNNNDTKKARPKTRQGKILEAAESFDAKRDGRYKPNNDKTGNTHDKKDPKVEVRHLEAENDSSSHFVRLTEYLSYEWDEEATLESNNKPHQRHTSRSRSRRTSERRRRTSVSSVESENLLRRKMINDDRRDRCPETSNGSGPNGRDCNEDDSESCLERVEDNASNDETLIAVTFFGSGITGEEK